jgi:hypothetical protein
MAPSGVHGQAAGAWKESEMARHPGGPLRTQPPGASNGAVEKRGLSSKLPAQTSKEIFPGQRGSKSRSGDRKIAERRVPKGNPLQRAQALHSGCGVGTRAPSYPRGCCRRGQWRRDKRQEDGAMSGVMQAAQPLVRRGTTARCRRARARADAHQMERTLAYGFLTTLTACFCRLNIIESECPQS